MLHIGRDPPDLSTENNNNGSDVHSYKNDEGRVKQNETHFGNTFERFIVVQADYPDKRRKYKES